MTYIIGLDYLVAIEEEDEEEAKAAAAEALREVLDEYLNRGENWQAIGEYFFVEWEDG